MGFLSRIFGGTDRGIDRAALERNVSIRMAKEGLDALSPSDFTATIIAAIVRRTIIRGDISAEKLEALEKRIGRLAHDQARRELPPPHPDDAEAYHLPHMHGEATWVDFVDGR